LCTKGNTIHNTSYRDKILEESKTKLDICMHRKKYSISTSQDFLTIIKEKAIKTSLLYCFNPLLLLFKALLHGQKDCVFFSRHLNV
jgi:hypothetical protein